jgi:hypothetical protein
MITCLLSLCCLGTSLSGLAFALQMCISSMSKLLGVATYLPWLGGEIFGTICGGIFFCPLLFSQGILTAMGGYYY